MQSTGLADQDIYPVKIRIN